MLSLEKRGSDRHVFYVIGDAQSAIETAEKTEVDGTFIAVTPPDWNGALSPWSAPRCFRDGEDFSGGADVFIEEMCRAIPDFEIENGISPEKRFLLGYSLAGLCAVYALFRTAIFAGAASVSGSMWFDGWLDFIAQNDTVSPNMCMYFSVGDKEKKTRNRRLAAVEDCTRAAAEIMAEKGARTLFELNPGNHFVDHPYRMARAVRGLLKLTETDTSI